jgi:DUF4097 and DUF4098 domain-containing protein YvlB
MRRHTTPSTLRNAILLVPIAISLSVSNARPDTSLTREVTRTFKVKGSVSYRNLAGQITISGASGDETSVRGVVHAIGRTAEDAQALLDALELRFDEKDGDLIIEARYPLDRHRKYHYPDFRPHSNSTTNSSYDGKRVVVTTRDEDDAVTLWVDLEVKLQRNAGIEVKELMGQVRVASVEGSVKIENGAGDITVGDMRGDIAAVTGSGDVDVQRHRGEVLIDTGSGDVKVDDAEGDVNAESGSGDVVVAKTTGNVNVDTGSGDVELSSVHGSIEIETGSGDTHIREAEGKMVTVSTGAGSIQVESPALFRNPAAAKARFDTGSGDVILLVDEQVSMVLKFDSGSGRVRSPRALEEKIERLGTPEERRYQIGGSASQVTVDTGAGDVVIRLVSD